MCNKSTAWIVAATVLGAVQVLAQVAPAWRHIGNTSIDRSLAGLATGPVERVSFTADGSRLLIRTASGRILETADFENWQPVTGNPDLPVRPMSLPVHSPEQGARFRIAGQTSARFYAFGKFAYRSEDGGANWENLTGYHTASIVGDGLRDLEVSPTNEDDIVIAGNAGVFRSLDGGKSWTSLNEGLANLPAMRLLSLPAGDRGVRLALQDNSVVEWEPGQKQAWTPVDNAEIADELRLRQFLSSQRGVQVTAVAPQSDYIYAGSADGELRVSADGGTSWASFPISQGGPVERFWVDPSDPRVALAVLGVRASETSPRAARVFRTQNGGRFWDDLTADLRGTKASGITADRASGAIYVATDQGVFMTNAELASLAPPQSWTALRGLPEGEVMDVRLDSQGNQLWAAVDGFGVYSILAPHRLRDPRVVSSADLLARATAPGALVTVLGAKVQSASAGGLQLPVLDANDNESQIQIPFEARGTSLSLAVDAPGGSVTLPAVPLDTAAPAIFVGQDGSPMLLDADSGVLLDAMTPARSRSHIEVLATGLGRVNPDWPTGIAAPLQNPPQVTGTVAAYLDREPVQVTRAVLAPYIGFYMVDIEVPKIVNSGPAELYLEVNGKLSNRVRLYIEP
jgi:uncharacterized protein (TIGR03437 family)